MGHESEISAIVGDGRGQGGAPERDDAEAASGHREGAETAARWEDSDPPRDCGLRGGRGLGGRARDAARVAHSLERRASGRMQRLKLTRYLQSPLSRRLLDILGRDNFL